MLQPTLPRFPIRDSYLKPRHTTINSPHHHTPQSNYPDYPLEFALTNFTPTLFQPMSSDVVLHLSASPLYTPAAPASLEPVDHLFHNTPMHDTMHVKLSIKLSTHLMHCAVIVPASPTTPSPSLSRNNHLSLTLLLASDQTFIPHPAVGYAMEGAKKICGMPRQPSVSAAQQRAVLR